MKSKLQIVEISALTVSIIITIWAMLRAAAWQIDFAAVVFVCWAISPYVIIYTGSVLLARYTSLPRVALVFCIISVLMLAFTLLVYVGTAGDDSSTYALIFIFVPIWLYAGAFLLLFVGLTSAWLIGRIGGGHQEKQKGE